MSAPGLSAQSPSRVDAGVDAGEHELEPEAPDAPGRDTSALRAALRARLPGAAFDTNPLKLVEALGILLVMAACYLGIRELASPVLRAGLGVVVGLGHLSLGFVAHDLSHGSVVRDRRLRAWVESVLWALNVTSASVWVVNHNRTHHLNTSSELDSFRYFARSERTHGRTLFALLFFPNRHLPYNPLVLLAYLLQIGMHTGAVLAGGGRRPGPLGPIPNVGEYGRGARLRLVAELVGIGLLQVGLWRFFDGSLAAWVWAAPVPWLVASAGASIYLYSQHGLLPLARRSDPMGATTLHLPRWVDRLHSFHAHHTAHHLFPSLRSDFYPAVTRLLQERTDAPLQTLGVLACWRRLFQNELYKPDPEPGWKE